MDQVCELNGEAVITALRFLWAVQGAPRGRLLTTALPDLAPRLRRLGERDIDDATAALLLKIAPALQRLLTNNLAPQ